VKPHKEHREDSLAKTARQSRGIKAPPKTAAAKSRSASAATAAKKRVVFVQGGGADVHDSWDNRLVASLEQALGAGYVVRYPRMPKEADPHPGGWRKAIARELGRARDGATILVAHSVGAAILLDFLAEADARRRISAVFLVAPPFIGEGGWPSDELRPTKQVATEIGDHLPVYLYFGAKDQTVPPSHGGLFEKAFPHAHVRRLPGRDHQLNDDLSAVAHDITTLESGGAPSPGVKPS